METDQHINPIWLFLSRKKTHSAVSFYNFTSIINANNYCLTLQLVRFCYQSIYNSIATPMQNLTDFRKVIAKKRSNGTLHSLLSSIEGSNENDRIARWALRSEEQPNFPFSQLKQLLREYISELNQKDGSAKFCSCEFVNGDVDGLCFWHPIFAPYRCALRKQLYGKGIF